MREVSVTPPHRLVLVYCCPNQFCLQSPHLMPVPAGPVARAALKRVGTLLQSLQHELIELQEQGLECTALLKAAVLLLDKYRALASAAPTTPRTALPTRIPAPTPAKKAASTTTTAPNPTLKDGPRMSPASPLTFEAVESHVQTLLLPI